MRMNVRDVMLREIIQKDEHCMITPTNEIQKVQLITRSRTVVSQKLRDRGHE